MINMYVSIYICGSAHGGYILRTGEILYVFTTSSMDMWQLAILILWIAWGGDFLWGLVVFGLHNFSHTDTASFRPRSQLVPDPIQILSHETLSGNNLCPLYGAIHRPLLVYVSAWKPASRNVKQLATSIDLKLGKIKISALKLKRENLTVHRVPVLAMWKEPVCSLKR
jgi:hypothetical protein